MYHDQVVFNTGIQGMVEHFKMNDCNLPYQ